MPYHIQKYCCNLARVYYIKNGKKIYLSKKPIPIERAIKQRIAVQINHPY